jgi:F0F1-type ATP synthase membrane subunit b/b'
MLLLALPEWLETYLNYPGLEAWKFINLAIFITVGIIILRKPLAQALAGRREAIQREILNAQEERERAAKELTDAEALVAHLDRDVETIKLQAREEADAERQRQLAAGVQETERLRAQAARELDLVQKAARKELRQFLAKRSVEMARESVVQELRPEDDLQLIRDRLSDFRRAKG